MSVCDIICPKGGRNVKIYKPGEFAKLLGVHIKTLQKWDRKGILKAHRTPTNRRFYTQEQYMLYMNGSI